MSERRIVVSIDENGKIDASTEGIKGEVCLTELQELLGDLADLESIKKTDEYYQKDIFLLQTKQKVGRLL